MYDIKVQIICVTYNQQDYIREALDGFVMQKTNFKFEVLVGDDCSTDGTSEIVAKYAQKYPDVIKHIRRETNIGPLANFMDLCESITAPYAAFCDGDDYWTDENKLQKQFDFMEKNEDVAVCSHLTGIKLVCNCVYTDYYKLQKRGLVIPSRLKLEKKIKADAVIDEIPHMSSLFIRWNMKTYPNWAKEHGVIGDQPIIFLNLGTAYFYCMNEIMSTYRKNDSGVLSDNVSSDDYFIKSRPEYFKLLTNFIKYYKINFPSVSISGFEKRLLLEIVNYINAIIVTDRMEHLLEIKEKYPDVYEKIKNLLSEYKYSLKQINKLGAKQAKLLRNSSVLQIIKPILEIIYMYKKMGKQIEHFIKKSLSFCAYWFFALVPKKKNLWIFSGFNKKNYMDNTKYLFEYIVQNHPEIEAIWLTKDKSVRKHLKENKLPVLKMTNLKGIWTTARAEVAFSDHFKKSDYKNIYGFNARTKFINIFHGFGPKGMKPIKEQIPNTTIPGVRLSSDIIIKKGDSLICKIIKLLKYPFIAPNRELFEEYFGIVCPGSPCNDFFATPWQVKDEAQLKCGYPRSANLYSKTNNLDDKFKIIYAPTYRWNSSDEKTMITNLIANTTRINNLMEKINGEFIFRLHPHTWRNYETTIKKAIRNYNRFSFNTEKDIYKTLNEYSMLITDYSSLGWEFLIPGKPVLYFAFDIDTYNSTDCPFDMDYNYICGGNIIKKWDDLLIAIEDYYNNPHKNIESREKIRELFYPSAYNDANNSERLINIVKEKIKGIK